MVRFVISFSLFITLSLFYSVAFSWDHQHISHWDKVYPRCRGHIQSPVNFNTTHIYQYKMKMPILFYGQDMEVMGADNGHTRGLSVIANNPTVKIEGLEYKLMSIHVHHISEHTINHHHTQGELHLLLSRNGKTVDHVLAILLKGSNTSNRSLQSLLSIFKAPGAMTTFNVHTLNSLEPNEPSYYQYLGSLTTPPCTEGITWMVFSTPIDVSHKQIQAIKAYHPYNYRPVHMHQLKDIKFFN